MGLSEEPTAAYYQYVADLPPGTYTHPTLGEVTVGEVYKFRAGDVAGLAGDPNWTRVDQKTYAAATAEEQS